MPNYFFFLLFLGTLTFKVRLCEKNIPTSLKLKTDSVLNANLPHKTTGRQSLYVDFLIKKKMENFL